MGAGPILGEKSLGLDGFSSVGMLAVAVAMLGLASSGVCSLGIRGAVVFCQGGKSTVSVLKKNVSLCDNHYIYKRMPLLNAAAHSVTPISCDTYRGHYTGLLFQQEPNSKRFPQIPGSKQLCTT